jgi:hypothetical protein
VALDPTPTPAGPTHAGCPACGSTRAETVLHWRDVPCNSALFLETEEEARSYATGSFRLTVCLRCGLIYNADFDPQLPEYSERNLESQLCSPAFDAFTTNLARTWIERYGLTGAHVLEVGAGREAAFLQRFCALSGGTGVGYDPVAATEGTPAVHVVKDMFDERSTGDRAAALICRHTLEHVWDLDRFFTTLRDFGANNPGAAFLFEVPDTARVLAETAFWDLYYEHCSYFTAETLAATFESHGFEVQRCYPGFGGQYLLLEAHLPPVRPAVRGVDAARIATDARSFARRFEAMRDQYRRSFEALAAEGTVLVWQASSKAAAMITTLGIAQFIAGLVDVNPLKRGRFIVGSGHRVLAPEDISGVAPRHVVIMNPIYEEEIAAMLGRRGVDAELHTADSLASGLDGADTARPSSGDA